MRLFAVQCWICIVVNLFLTLAFSGVTESAAIAASAPGAPSVLIGYQDGGDGEYAILVEKKSQQLFLYGVRAGEFREVLRFPCSTGKKQGRKTASGDSKTPEGIYFFTKEHGDEELSPIYGVKAFPIDYPNLMDRRRGRGGNSIWLHGTNKPMKERDSNGCIVLENAAISTLAPYVTLNRTPIIIVDTIQYRTDRRRPDDRDAVLTLIDNWNRALSAGTYHDFLRFYDAEYLPDIAWWPTWNRSRKSMDDTAPGVDVTFKKTSIFQHDNLYVAIFDQLLRRGDVMVSLGVKKVFLHKLDGEFKIVGDGFQKQFIAEKPGAGSRENPIVAGLDRLGRMQPDEKATIAKMVDAWILAWSSKDIRRYGGFYAADFISSGKNLKQYLKYKAGLNRKYKAISVKKEKMTIDVGTRTSTVSFVQTYESSGYRAVGIKQLVLKKEGGRWKIYRENWKRL